MKYIFHNFINTLRHYKASSLLNVIGMAVAFAAFYIILTQVKWGFTYNQGIKDGERIFVLSTSDWQDDGYRSIHMCRPFAEKVLSSVSGVESYGTSTFQADYDGSLYYLKDDEHVRKFKAATQQISQGILSVFGFEAESGKFEDLSKPGAIAISSEFARKNSLKVGDHISQSPTGEPADMEIVAIWNSKFQKNSSPGSIDFICDLKDKDLEASSEWSYPYFVKLKSADDKDAFEKSANDGILKLLKEDFEEENDGDPEEFEYQVKKLKVALIPMEELYYRNDISFKGRICRSGNRTTDTSLLAVAMLIIVIALINFINFFFALVPSRVRSVNTYKIFGTSRTSLTLNFIMESVGLVLLALVLSAVIAVAFAKSSLTEILTAPIDFTSNIPVLLITFAVAIVGAVVSSIYPALYITSFQPALALKGSFSSSRAGRGLRSLLIGVQFTISMALIICASFIKLQHKFMMDYDMGFNKEYLISGEMPSTVSWYGSKNEAFENRLRSNPYIIDMTWSDGEVINMNRMSWGRDYKGKNINFQCFPVAYNFLDVMGIDIVKGRNFTKSDEQAEKGVMIFNNQARKEFDITLDANGPGHAGNNTEVAGICSDFNFRPLRGSGCPFAFYVFGKDHSWMPQGLSHLYLRTAAGADPAKVMDFVRKTAMEVAPDEDPDNISLNLFDEELGRKYQAENRLGRQITAFTVVAIILALMGVFGLVLFETQHRKKEIAVRRVLGAEVKDILKMFCRKYAVIVLVCFLVAAPLSWMITDRYFSNFAYRTPMHWWVFVLSLLIVLVITIGIVIARSWSAATSNPVEAIKAE